MSVRIKLRPIRDVFTSILSHLKIYDTVLIHTEDNLENW